MQTAAQGHAGPSSSHRQTEASTREPGQRPGHLLDLELEPELGQSYSGSSSEPRPQTLASGAPDSWAAGMSSMSVLPKLGVGDVSKWIEPVAATLCMVGLTSLGFVSSIALACTLVALALLAHIFFRPFFCGF